MAKKTADILGADAQALLTHQCKTISKDQIHLPGSDFVDRVFVHHDLPHGTYRHRGELVDPAKITKTALMTVEGERDDISGLGQTEAAHDLCPNIPAAKKLHHLQMKVGHYGVFSGSKFRAEVAPKIKGFFQQTVK